VSDATFYVMLFYVQMSIMDIKGVMVMLCFWLKMKSLHNIFYLHI